MVEKKFKNYSLEVGTVGLGENADGTLNSFPLADLAERTAARDRQERATAYAVEHMNEEKTES